MRSRKSVVAQWRYGDEAKGIRTPGSMTLDEDWMRGDNPPLLSRQFLCHSYSNRKSTFIDPSAKEENRNQFEKTIDSRMDFRLLRRWSRIAIRG
jgi:hypothetical protein